MQTKTISSESSLTKSSCATAWVAPASEYTPHEKKSARRAVELVIACVTAEKCGRYVTA